MGVLVGWGVGVGSDELCSDEHEKRNNAKGRANRNTLLFIFKKLVIRLLLADRVLQNAQSFDLHNNFISVLQLTNARRRASEDQITRLESHN